MAHEIFGERFVSLRRPCWHSIGLRTEQEMSAAQALDAIKGRIQVHLHPVHTVIEGHEVTLPNQQIVRYPTPDDAEFVLFGLVGPEYELITPCEIADIWDQHVGKPIETMGLLGRGELLFCTTKLPTLDIKGDEVEEYLGVCSPMDGRRSASAEVWPLRVVCQNTLRMAQQSAKVQYRVVHDGTAKERIGKWMGEAYRKAESNYQVIKESFELLASKRVSEADSKEIIAASYPLPKLPRMNAPDEVMQKRIKAYEQEKPRIERRRTTALALFNGDGTGMDTPAAKGTLWGLYNSVVELEDYRKGSMVGGSEAEARRAAEDALFGGRAASKGLAFSACLAVANGKSPLSVGRRNFNPSLN